MIQFSCPKCSRQYSAGDDFRGSKSLCLDCGTAIRVPDDADSDEEGVELEEVVEAGKTSKKSGPARKPEPPKPAKSAEATKKEPKRENPDGKRSKKKAKPAKGRSIWLTVAAVTSGLVLVLGLAAVIVWRFVWTDQPAPKPPQAAVVVTPPAAKPKDAVPPAPAAAPAATSKPPVVPSVVTPADPVRLTAAHLAREYADDPVVTDALYADKVLEVRGEWHSTGVVASQRFLESDKSAVTGVACTLANPKPKEVPTIPVHGRAVVVRGTYKGQMKMIEGEVVRNDCEADVKYGGKPITLRGKVGKVFGPKESTLPSLQFQLESAAGRVDVVCVFPEKLRAQIQAMTPGDLAVVSGACKGRLCRVVRLESCELLAAADGADVDAFAREFETDLLDYTPLLDHYDGAPLWTTRVLARNEAGERGSLRTLLWKPIGLRGKVLSVVPLTQSVVLESGGGEPLQFNCRFRSGDFQRLGSTLKPGDSIGEDFPIKAVYGVYSGRLVNQITLEDCLLPSWSRSQPVVEEDRTSVDYLPHQINTVMYYYGVKVEAKPGDKETPSVPAPSEKPNNKAPSTPSPGREKERPRPSFFPEDKTPFTKKIHGPDNTVLVYSKISDRNPAGTFFGVERYRLKPPFVEVGFVGDGRWSRMLKLGVKTGDKWVDGEGEFKAEYQVTGFATSGSTRTVTVRRRITLGAKSSPKETEYVYEKGIGLVRMAEYDVESATPTTPVSELRLWKPEPPKKSAAVLESTASPRP